MRSLALVFVTAIIPPSLLGTTGHYGEAVNIFHCVPMSLYHWLILIGLGVTPIIVVEIQKLFIRIKMN